MESWSSSSFPPTYPGPQDCFLGNIMCSNQQFGDCLCCRELAGSLSGLVTLVAWRGCLLSIWRSLCAP